MQAPGVRKDPFTAFFLSLLFPGAGFAYVGDFGRFLTTALVVFGLSCASSGRAPLIIVAGAIHVLMAVTSAGAAKTWNARQADVPPLPPPGAARRHPGAPSSGSFADVPPPPPPVAARPAASAPATHGPPLTADEFLGELRSAWQAHRDGDATDAEFAERKASAIARVKAADWNDGVALLEAASSLVGAGILTPAERNRLKLRVGTA